MDGHPPTTAPGARGEGPRPTRVTRIQVWAPSGEMYVSRADGTLEPVEARDAVYLDDRGSYTLRASAVVFIHPATGHAWAGPRADGYLDTPDGIIGVSVADGVVCWCDSGIRAARPGDTLDSLAQRFEGQKLDLRLFDARQGSQSDVRAFVEEAFFGERPGSAGFGKAHLISLGLDGQTVEMELASPTDAFRAFLRFDLKTRSLLRAVDHTGAETPRSVLQNLVKDVREIRPVAAGDRVPLKVGKQSITGFYRVGKGPTSKPATPDDADVAVTLSWFEGAEQAQAAFRQRVEARHGTPSSPPNAPYPFKPLLTYRWPDGRILQCLANRIVEVGPRRPVPGDVAEQLLRACVRRWAGRGVDED